jgi:hypothetical protein
LLRSSLVLLALAVWLVPLSGAAARGKSSSVSAWAKAKGKLKPEPKGEARESRIDLPPPPGAPAAAGKDGKENGGAAGSSGSRVNGKVAVFGFAGDGAGRVQQAVISTLRTHGLQVNTTLRPVDSAEQYREMGATLQLAAYIEGAVGGDGSHATVHVRSGTTGRRIASIHFSGDRSGLAADVGSKLWPKTGSRLARLCAEAAKPRKRGGRGPMRIDAGSPLEATAQDDSDVPRHLRTGKRRDDPWAADDRK